MDRREPNHDPSVFSEPHMRARPVDHEGADALSEEPVRAGRVQSDLDEDDAESVRDEPAMAWNARALDGIDGFEALLARRRSETGDFARLLALICLVLWAGPFGVFGAFWSTLGGADGRFVTMVVIGPVIEELTKVALLLWVAERKPWLLFGSLSIVMTGFLSGATFGAIENLIYLRVYFPDRADEIAPWRWLATAPMHAIASTIAALGVAAMWRACMRSGRRPSLSIAYPWLVVAMILHALFNATAIALSIAGIAP